ncbi:MAG: ABC transporter substrate-binding protein [Nannocystaceae bacterium]|nr:ABC transporter substrate-binding protein [Nannocystaceae bacterium]
MVARGARKPEFQFCTGRHRAVRRSHETSIWPDDERAEAFDLLDADGQRVGVASLGMRAQVVDRSLADDPGLPYAVKAWLAARGARSIALTDEDGWALAQGSFTVSELSTSGDRAVTEHGGGAARIVTLAPSNADIVVALHAFDRVVACEASSEPPVGFETVERLGPDLAPDLDRIAALAPDLVLSSLSVPGMERVVTGLQARGISQLVLAPQSLADVMAEIEAVAVALGIERRGQDVVGGMQREVAELQSSLRSPAARVYLEWWPKPMFTPGADCFSRELIELAGGRNVFGDRPGASNQIDADALLAADPDVCFLSWCGVAEDKIDPSTLARREGLQGLRAAEQGHVHVLDERFSGRPGPRMLEAARRMAAVIAELPIRSR